jgi:lipopolysaccharide/colanic/teichoic acid biosynthesis glycosyltransferase
MQMNGAFRRFRGMLAATGRIAAAGAIGLGFPIHLLIALLIRLCDGGPVFYRAARLGRNGNPYELLKYRSMKVGSVPIVADDYKVIALERDSRVTAIGRLLRCGIDELPQLYNVVRGEMSWIGPRPDEPWMLENYGSVVRTRLSVLPGITGLAQVCNARSISTAQAYAIDIWYIRNRTMWLDLWIALVTPLFIAGVRSVGARRLRELHHLSEFSGLQRACEMELEAGRRKMPRDAQPVQV